MDNVYSTKDYSKKELQLIEIQALKEGKAVMILNSKKDKDFYNDMNAIIIEDFEDERNIKNVIYDNLKFVFIISFIIYTFNIISNDNLTNIKTSTYSDIQYKEYMSELARFH